MLIAVMAAIVTSCSTSQNVGGGMIQKRKYTKGFYWNHGGGNASAKQTVTKDEQPYEAIETAAVAEPIVPQTVVENRTAETPVATVTTPVSTTTAAIPAEQRTAAAPAKKAPLTPVSAAASKKASKPQASLKKNKISKQSKSKGGAGAGSDVEIILLVIIAIFIPPLAVGLFEGITTRFWIDLILFLIGIGLGLGLGGIAYLCLLISVIYALLIVLGAI